MSRFSVWGGIAALRLQNADTIMMESCVREAAALSGGDAAGCDFLLGQKALRHLPADAMPRAKVISLG